MRSRRCSGLSTRNSPPNDQNAWPPSDASGSWSTSSTRRPASASSAVATRPANPPPTTMTSARSLIRRILTAALTAGARGGMTRASGAHRRECHVPVQPPSPAELVRLAAQFGFELEGAELAEVTALAAGMIASYQRLDELD